MAEQERDDEISRRYRELGREEPPRAVDDAILAAARRELETRPAPLVAPTGRRRWSVPIAAAAVIILSAVVTLHVQREQPDEELAATPSAPAPAQQDDKVAVAPSAAPEQDKLAAQARKAEPYQEKREAAKPQGERRRAQEPALARPAPAPATPATLPPLADRAEPKPPAEPGRFAPDPAPSAAPPSAPAAPAPQMQMRPRAAEATAGAAERQVEAESARDLRQRALGSVAKRADLVEPPERMLERIATLRREGRHKEADDLFAEFKRRFPDYRIPDAMREQVLPR